MIEWKQYDKNNQPKQGVKHLITDGEVIRVGSIESFGSIGNHWADQFENSLIPNVTHYSEFNLPVK